MEAQGVWHVVGVVGAYATFCIGTELYYRLSLAHQYHKPEGSKQNEWLLLLQRGGPVASGIAIDTDVCQHKELE